MRPDSNFDETLAQFQKLLEHEKYSTNIVRVMPDDALLSGQRFIYLHFPVPNANEMKARKMFEKGMANGRGLIMSTLCELKGSTCCYLWYPKSKRKSRRDCGPRTEALKCRRARGNRGYRESQ